MNAVIRILPLYFVMFFGFVGYSLIITIFTPLFMEGHSHIIAAGATKQWRVLLLGIVIFLYPAAQFFGSPILGSLSDRFGRKPVLLVSLVLSCIAYAFIALALYWENLTLLVVSLIVAGLSEANVAIAQAAIADIATADNRTRLFGYTFVAASSAYILGPLVGGRLADPHLVSWFDNATPFWASLILLVLMFFWVMFGFRETFPKESRHAAHWLQPFINMIKIFTSGRVSYILLCNFLLYYAAFGFFRSYPMYLVNDFGMGVASLSYFVAWVSVPILIGNLFLLRLLLKVIPASKLCIGAAFFTAIFTITIPLFSPEWTLWITLFLATLGISIILPTSVSILSDLVSAKQQGSTLGNNQALQVGAEAISGLISGALAAAFISLPLYIVAASAVAGGLMLIPYLLFFHKPTLSLQ